MCQTHRTHAQKGRGPGFTVDKHLDSGEEPEATQSWTLTQEHTYKKGKEQGRAFLHPETVSVSVTHCLHETLVGPSPSS